MPCQSYDNSWDSGDDDRRKIRELKKQADMLARIACKALEELEKNEVEDMLLLADDEVRTWWAKHKEDDRKEQARQAEIERKARIKQEALDRLSDEEKELLGLAPKKSPVAKAVKSRGPGSNTKTMVVDIETILNKYSAVEYEHWENKDQGEI